MKAPCLMAMVCALELSSCEKESATPPEHTPGTPAARAVAPDDSAVNTRDRDAAAATTGAVGQTRAEILLEAEIRKRIGDTKMSADAHNVKVVVHGGKVALRGRVPSQQEKDAVEKIAGDVAGAANVENELEVAAAATMP